jgi:glutaredoxin
VQFSEYDVAKDLDRQREMIQKSGQMGVPVIDIDGNIVVGYNRGKIAELLGVNE